MSKTKNVLFRASENEKHRLDELADKCKMTRSQILRHLLNSADVQEVVTEVVSVVPVVYPTAKSARANVSEEGRLALA